MITFLDVEAADIVEVVKGKVQDREGIPLNQERLILDRKQLEDSRCMSDGNVGGDLKCLQEH